MEIRAEVADLTMFSAHADSTEILRWLSSFTSPPSHTFIVHGEPAASATLRDRIESQLGWPCSIPRMEQRFELAAATAIATRVN
jgi:metallo-beta-lactamase family protein